MKFILRSNNKKINGIQRKFGIFYCKFCNKKVEKPYPAGLKYKSCGCNKNKKHGDRRNSEYSNLYNIWKSMKQRCYNKNRETYKYYGGKGIKICDQWKKHYIIFKIWALCNGYKKGLTIDRINNNKEYKPSNCRWVTKKVNNRNRSKTKLDYKKINQIKSLYFNVKITQKLLSKLFNVPPSTISNIINNKIWI